MSSWQGERHDDEIRRLEKRLYAAEDKIRILEGRPMEWLLKAEMAAMWILVAALDLRDRGQESLATKPMIEHSVVFDHRLAQ